MCSLAQYQIIINQGFYVAVERKRELHSFHQGKYRKILFRKLTIGQDGINLEFVETGASAIHTFKPEQVGLTQVVVIDFES